MMPQPTPNIENLELALLIRPQYALHDLRALFRFLARKGTFRFQPLPSGLFPAVGKENRALHSGYHNVWVRDNVFVAFAHLTCGRPTVAARTATSLLTFFQKHAHRFDAIIQGKADANDPMQRPHIRFDGRALGELPEKWPHAQNDALGYFVWLYASLLRQGHLRPQPEALAMLAKFVQYFEKIRYWEDEDSGHWEEVRKISASSIGCVVAGLQALQAWFREQPRQAELPAAGKQWPPGRPTAGGTDAVLQPLIQAGEQALARILPAECVQPEPEKARPADAALLFLIFPLNVVPGAQADAILARVHEQLQGTYGIRRYSGDSYWAPDYKRHLPAEARAADFSEDMARRRRLLEKPGDEAQWCIFDPIVSCIYAQRYLASNDPADLHRQTAHFNRAIGQITRSTAETPGFRCAELYYKENGAYVPNDHLPLLWTQANLWVAFHMLERSVQAGTRHRRS